MNEVKVENATEIPKKSGLFKNYKYPRLIPLWIAMFVDILGFSLILPLSDYFLKEYHSTPFIVGIVLGINGIFTLFFAPILGRLSDKYGRRPLLLISQMGTFTAFVMLAFSTSLEMVFISRIIDGIFGGNFPIAKAIISDTVPPKDRPVQMTNVGICFVLASLVGPGLGGVLSIWGTLVSGLVAACLSGITMVLSIFYIKESWPKEKRDEQHKEKVQIKIRKNKNVMYLLTQYGLHDVSFMIYMSTFVLFASIALGLNGFQSGILLMISGAFRALIRFTIFKPTLNKLGVDNTLKLGLSLFVGIFFLLSFVNNWVQAMILLLLVSFAASCTRGILISKISSSVTPKIQGKINGISSALDSFSQFVGPVIGGFILWALPSFYLGLFITIFASLAFIMIFKKIDLEKSKPQEHGPPKN